MRAACRLPKFLKPAQRLLLHQLSSQAPESLCVRTRDELAAARKKVVDAADLTKCQDGNADTGVSIDVNSLRATYDGILRDFDAKLGAILDEAQQKFDALVAAAPTKVITPKNEKDTEDGDKEEKDDDDD